MVISQTLGKTLFYNVYRIPLFFRDWEIVGTRSDVDSRSNPTVIVLKLNTDALLHDLEDGHVFR
ncbi:hypothetical protein HI914_01085 [Erysiphe necator]|nr:hypothetical protein HI914_01085 [Erysiphe necator]